MRKLVEGIPSRQHPLYITWVGMRYRCSNPNHISYKYYGAKGVTVCDRWNRSFENFVLDMGPRPSNSHTLDRIDNEKGYEPENCRWSTGNEQSFNRKRFSKNRSGYTGVFKTGPNSWQARFEWEGEQYILGYFKSASEAADRRDKFKQIFFFDREMAICLLPKDVSPTNSSTGIKGISFRKTGTYVVRHLVDGKRVSVGTFKTLEEARDARTRFIEKQTQRT